MRCDVDAISGYYTLDSRRRITMIITAANNYQGLDEWLEGKKKVLLVCGKSFESLGNIYRKIESATTPIVRFSKFQPNPLYENVVEGTKLFREEGCDAIIAIGGGSAIDVAKCIKLYSGLPGNGENGSWLHMDHVQNNIPFLVMPTTAGTGSEATRFAVIYYEGKKQSITDENFIPDTVLMDPDCLKTLPDYQKKASMCDALSHALESFWSVNSTDESKAYSREAISLILENMDRYLDNSEEGRANMLLAANIAGKAINITQTTAGHAMCYKITSLFGCVHGHAAMLCNRVLFPWMVRNIDKCIDPRGVGYLKQTLDEVGQAMDCPDAYSGAEKFCEIFDELGFDIPKATDEQYEDLKTSVNPERLRNHPVQLTEETINDLYHEILRYQTI